MSKYRHVYQVLKMIAHNVYFNIYHVYKKAILGEAKPLFYFYICFFLWVYVGIIKK